MACEAEKAAFDATLKRIQASLREELSNVAQETESKTKDLSDKFKDNNDLAQGVGEPPRFLRRLQSLRGWSHEEVEQVLTRGP